MRHFFAQPGSNLFTILAALDDVREYSLRVHQIDVAAVRDEIVLVASLRFLLRDVDAIFPDDAVDLRLVSVQPNDPWIKRLQVLGQDVARVALRVDRYEYLLELVCIPCTFLK